MDGVAVIEQEEAYASRELAQGIGEVGEFFSLFVDEGVLDSLGDDESSLIQLPSLEADGQRSVVLIILGLNIDILIKQVQYREEVILFTCIMQQGSFEHID